jgi:hypothetical protein
MSTNDYVPPKVWTHLKPNGGVFESINRPTAGATFERHLPKGKHPLQLYSQGTWNGMKVTMLLEELLEAGLSGAEYDAWLMAPPLARSLLFRFHEFVNRKSELSLASSGKSLAVLRPARATMRGRLRDRHGTLARVAMDAVASGACTGRKRLQRTAKSCGPGAATLASIRPACAGTATVTIKAAHRGEHEGNRNTIARGKPGCPGCTCSSTPCAFLSHTGYGRSRRPAFPAPSDLRGDNEIAQPGQKRAAGMRAHVSTSLRRKCPDRPAPAR